MKKGHVALILTVSLLVTVWLVLKREFSLNKIGLRAVEELSEEGGKTVVSIEEVDAFFSEHSVVVFRGGEEVIGGRRTYCLERCEFALGRPPRLVRPCHNVLSLYLAPK